MERVRKNIPAGDCPELLSVIDKMKATGKLINYFLTQPDELKSLLEKYCKNPSLLGISPYQNQVLYPFFPTIPPNTTKTAKETTHSFMSCFMPSIAELNKPIVFAQIIDNAMNFFKSFTSFF